MTIHQRFPTGANLVNPTALARGVAPAGDVKAAILQSLAPLRVVCSWCGTVLREGSTDEDGRVSHGICTGCADRWRAGRAR